MGATRDALHHRLGVPEKRLLVIASVLPHEDHLEAIARRRPDAVMSSAHYVKGKDKWPRIREVLDTWSQYRYLDSGAFTLINKGESVTEQWTDERFEEYCDFLRQYAEDFSWVVELDVDSVNFAGKPRGYGVGLTRKYRAKLKDLLRGSSAGLLPVWHRAARLDAWKELIAEYRYVAIGYDTEDRGAVAKLPKFHYLVELAHRHQPRVAVHALGVGSEYTMKQVPYDTADSTDWLEVGRHGKFGDVKYSERKPHWAWTANELLEARRLEQEVEASDDLDPEWLTGTPAEKFQVAIARIQQQQERLQW